MPTREEVIESLKTVEPIADRVVVIPDEKPKMSGGIHLSQTAVGEDELQTATVIAVGKGYHADNGEVIPTESKVGDRVLLNKYAGDTIRIDLDKSILPSHTELTDDLIPVRILRQDAIIFTFPKDWL
jgi:chaperonin GroES